MPIRFYDPVLGSFSFSYVLSSFSPCPWSPSWSHCTLGLLASFAWIQQKFVFEEEGRLLRANWAPPWSVIGRNFKDLRAENGRKKFLTYMLEIFCVHIYTKYDICMHIAHMMHLKMLHSWIMHVHCTYDAHINDACINEAKFWQLPSGTRPCWDVSQWFRLFHLQTNKTVNRNSPALIPQFYPFPSNSLFWDECEQDIIQNPSPIFM